MTFEERCKLATKSLPDSPYKDALDKLLGDMLECIKRGIEPTRIEAQLEFNRWHYEQVKEEIDNNPYYECVHERHERHAYIEGFIAARKTIKISGT